MEHKPEIIAIAAIGENREIGFTDGRLLWPISADLKRFKEFTTGFPIVMGRKTFETFPKGPLPNRTNIVVTANPDYQREGIVVAHSLEEALATAKGGGREKTFIIGGGSMYKEALPYTDTLELTHVHAEQQGDNVVVFPEFEKDFHETWRGETHHDDKNNVDYHHATWKRNQ